MICSSAELEDAPRYLNSHIVTILAWPDYLDTPIAYRKFYMRPTIYQLNTSPTGLNGRVIDDCHCNPASA